MYQFYLMPAYLHHVRFQMRMVALVQTQVLIAIPVPNMEKRLIFSTIRLGRFLIVHSGIGLLVCEAIVTLASHLLEISQRVHKFNRLHVPHD